MLTLLEGTQDQTNIRKPCGIFQGPLSEANRKLIQLVLTTPSSANCMSMHYNTLTYMAMWTSVHTPATTHAWNDHMHACTPAFLSELPPTCPVLLAHLQVTHSRGSGQVW